MSDQEKIEEVNSPTGESSQCCSGHYHDHGMHECMEHVHEMHCCGGKPNSWWEERSIAGKVLLGIGIGILVLIGLMLIGLITMKLWNGLMPEIFGVKTINYWQAWGLLLLSFILFKNWDCSGDSHRQDRKRKKELRRHMYEECCKEEKASAESES